MPEVGFIKGEQFADFLIRRAPHFDKDILKDVNPVQSWIGHVETGPFPSGSGATHTQDRIHKVYPDLTGPWENFPDGSCIGGACDPVETRIGFGYSRDTYTMQRRSYGTDLFCWDQMITADKAMEQMDNLIENLREVTQIVVSDRIKTEAFRLAGRTWVANATCATFTATWNEAKTILTPSVLPTSKLTAKMLQRRVQPQIVKGALGKNVQGAPMMLELVTDLDSAWSLKVGEGDVESRWQFTQFGTVNEFYKYGWTGQVGNYGVRPDLFPIRFQLLPNGTLQRVFPFRNVATTDGIKQEYNEQYDRCIYQVSFIWHRRGMKVLTLDATSVHAQMPFVVRDFGGKWKFVQDNLGADANGRAIENKRRNKGQFIADFALATKPQYTEFIEAVLHLREPASVIELDITDDTLKANNYSAQDYNSANDGCTPEPMYFEPTLTSGGVYSIAVNSITCNGARIVHEAVGGTGIDTLGELVQDLSNKVGILGSWAVGTGEYAGKLKLTNYTCNAIVLPFAS